jgi:hypothetical protein
LLRVEFEADSESLDLSCAEEFCAHQGVTSLIQKVSIARFAFATSSFSDRLYKSSVSHLMMTWWDRTLLCARTSACCVGVPFLRVSAYMESCIAVVMALRGGHLAVVS